MKTTILSLFLIAASSAPAMAQNPDAAPPSLNVTGIAQLRVDPDQATVRLGVTRQGTTAQIAQDQTNTTAQEILNAVTKLNITREHIQTSRLTLSPVFAPRRPDSNDPPKIVAYNSSNVISVMLEDLTKIGPVIDAGLKAGANQLEGVQFNLKNDLLVREQALKQAVTEARSKAEAMAEALNLRLVNILEVSEGGVSVNPRFAEPQAYMAKAASDIAPTPVSPGQLDVQASVTVRYRITGR